MEWISISERLPEKPGQYLVYLPKLKLGNGILRINWDGENFEIKDYACEITHWTPLPSLVIKRDVINESITSKGKITFEC